jgi:hypothetical protein
MHRPIYEPKAEKKWIAVIQYCILSTAEFFFILTDFKMYLVHNWCRLQTLVIHFECGLQYYAYWMDWLPYATL